MYVIFNDAIIENIIKSGVYKIIKIEHAVYKAIIEESKIEYNEKTTKLAIKPAS